MSRPLGGMALVAALLCALGGGFLWYGLTVQRHACEVCVEFGGRRSCATASGPSGAAAARAAQATACGTLARGRVEMLRCLATRPTLRRCRKL